MLFMNILLTNNRIHTQHTTKRGVSHIHCQLTNIIDWRSVARGWIFNLFLEGLSSQTTFTLGTEYRQKPSAGVTLVAFEQSFWSRGSMLSTTTDLNFFFCCSVLKSSLEFSNTSWMFPTYLNFKNKGLSVTGISIIHVESRRIISFSEEKLQEISWSSRHNIM